MDRIVDKAVVLACCALSFAVAPWSGATVVALLLAVTASATAELVRERTGVAVACAYTAAAIAVPACDAFAPLPLYDLARTGRAWARAASAVAAVAIVARAAAASPQLSAAIAAGSAAALLLAHRSRRASLERACGLRLRDAVREQALSVEAKYAELADRQDLEVRLATLGERSRIAREIHDNVGHLLTRAVLQVKALEVVHRDDPRVAGELADVGATVNEALDAVRASVHDLHDDGFDLETQLRALAAGTDAVAVEVAYRADDVPQTVGYGFLSIAREALSNAVRHSDANRIVVSVAEHPGFYRLVVRDNGSTPPISDAARAADGAPSADGAPQHGIGLVTMRDRATALGGTFKTTFDRGFVVFVTVPKRSGAATATEQGERT